MRTCLKVRLRGLFLAALMAAMFVVVPSLHGQDKAADKLDKETLYLHARQKLQEPLALSYGDLAIAVRDPGDEILGATLAPLSDALRAQLNIPAGQGLLVASLRRDGPSAQAGLERFDVLLTLAGNSLASADDLTRHLKAAGEVPVTLKVLRSGKQIALQVRPVYRVTLGRIGEEKKEYFLGISLSGLDEALRSQLALPAGQGVIITDVIKSSPAEAAGIKAHDIVLELGGKSVDAPDKLAALVQAGQDKPTTIKLLRAGKPLNVAITAATRHVDHLAAFISQDLVRLYNIETAKRTEREGYVHQLKLTTEAKSLQKIEELQRQIQSLRQAIDQLDRSLKANQSPKN